jgi:hypothetical protein
LNATVGVRARIGLGAAHAEAEQKGYRLSLPGETQRYPGSVHVRGNFFIAAAFKLEHDAKQIGHLVAAGKLPPGFRHLEGAYLDIYRGIHHSTRAQFMTQKLLNVKQHALLFGAHNALVYLPPEESVRRALGAQFLREASILEAAYLEDAKHGRAPAFYADGFLSNEALETLYEWCLDATVWFDKGKMGHNTIHLTSDRAGIDDWVVHEDADDHAAEGEPTGKFYIYGMDAPINDSTASHQESEEIYLEGVHYFATLQHDLQLTVD